MRERGHEPGNRGEPLWQREATAYAERIAEMDDCCLLCLLTALNTELASLRDEALPRRGVRARPEPGAGRPRHQSGLLLRREVVRRALTARGLLPAL